MDSTSAPAAVERKYDSESASKDDSKQASFVQSPAGGTLPHFADFDADFSTAAALPYKTPFDSPDPVVAPSASSVPGDATLLPSLDHAQQQRAREQHVRSFSMDEYACSIFHTPVKAAAPAQEPEHEQPASLQKSQSVRQPKKHKSRQPKPISTDSASASSASAASSSFLAPPLPPRHVGGIDPVAEAVIPDILSATSVLARRASEPTINANRRPRPVPSHIDVSEKLDTRAASDVNNVGPFQNVATGAVTPRPQCKLCDGASFASNLCSLHLTSQFEPATPTTVIRRVFTMWSRQATVSTHLKLQWNFWNRGEFYTVTLLEDQWSGERTVSVNGRVNYRGSSESGEEWRLSMVLGRSKSSAFECILGATPHHGNQRTDTAPESWSYSSEYTHDLWISGFPFVEAHKNWMSELGSAQQMRLEEQEAERKQQAAASAVPSTPLAHKQHYEALSYIKQYWHRTTSQTKTSLGNPKNTVLWQFTIAGAPHTLKLTHSELSGKRRIDLDGKLLLAKKPNFLNGLLLKRSATHRIQLSGVNLELKLQKLAHRSDATNLSFFYELFVESIPFQACCKTLAEYAGGMVDVEKKLQIRLDREKRNKRREAELKRDPRTVLSPMSPDANAKAE